MIGTNTFPMRELPEIPANTGDSVWWSGEDISHHPPGDIGQPEVASLGTIRQLLVVDAQDVQHRRMQVVNLHRRRHRVIAEVVGFPRSCSRA